mmetsp:Transcript_75616/g.244840  ORF Transcript_75616/g.244840 Transcript_75616/m.244840 type:complete len:1182 (-) Transcript_75616:76-3621(-)
MAHALAIPAAVRGAAMPPEVAGQIGKSGRLPGGGPAGRAPLVRAVRTKQPDLRRIASAWHERFERDRHAAMAELVSLVLVVADVPSHSDVARDDVQDREPGDVVQQLVASLALEASEKGADFTQHWLVSRERGAQRVRENYPVLWREIASTSSCESLLEGLLQLLRDWTLALAECQFRSVRHAASVAALHIVEGLGVQCNSLSEFCGTAAMQIRDAEAQGASSRFATLSAEHEQATRTMQSLAAARDAMGVALLSRRTKDVDPEVRRSCFEAFRRWASADIETFLTQQWTRYLHFGLSDRDPKTRAAVLSALEELLKDNPSVAPHAIQGLVEHIRPRILARCHDVDPQVGAAAIRCTAAIAARNLLGEEEFDPVIDLVWDPDARRSTEAASFVTRFVLSEDVIDYPTSGLSAGHLLPAGSSGGAARRKVMMLLQFLGEYTEGHFQLVDRLVASLWKRASCLEDWETIANLALPGGEHALTGNIHTALVHLAEATVRLAAHDVASDNGSAHAEAVLDRAARALSARLPAFFTACQSEPAAMRRAASLYRHILGHCSARRNQGGAGAFCDGLLAGPQGEAAAEALKTAFMRQPDPDTLEYIAEAFAYLLDLSERARPVILDLTGFLHEKMMKLVPMLSGEAVTADVPPADALLAVATRLRILAKAVDVSLCQVRSFLGAALGLLDDRADAVARGYQPATGPLLAVTLLELLVIVLMRHAAALIQPDPLPHCVVHDPINQKELKELTLTAARDFCKVAAELLQSDPVPHVRTAALATAIALLTSWANAVRFTEASRADGLGASPEVPWLQLDDQLAVALCSHMGELLTEANGVPPDCGNFAALPEPGNPKHTSAFSLVFASVHQALTSAMGNGAGEESTSYVMSDSEKVRMAALACNLVTACQHPDVADSNLPAVVLTQALSNRDDLQEVAWMLLKRLRKEAHMQTDSASVFFKVLMHAVHMVHRDGGVEVASDLSVRLLQHTGVGKLALGMQVALIAALQAGVQTAIMAESSPGFLEALVPWVTKHIVDDALLLELAAWVEAEGPSFASSGADDAAAAQLEAAGVPAFLAACRATAARGERQTAAVPLPSMPALGEAAPDTPEAGAETPGADEQSGGGQEDCTAMYVADEEHLANAGTQLALPAPWLRISRSTELRAFHASSASLARSCGLRCELCAVQYSGD